MSKRKKTRAAGPNVRRAPPPSPHAARLAAGLEHFRAGDMQAAEAAYRAVLRDDPHDPDALHLLAQLALRTGHAAAAADLARTALARRPRDAEILHTLGRAQHARGELEEAADLLRAATRERPDFALAHTSLGELLTDLGRPEEAVRCHERALAADPGCLEARLNLAATREAQGRTDAALACYRQALSLAPARHQTLARMGAALERLFGERVELLGEALGAYQAALRNLPPGVQAEGDLRHLYQAVVPRWHFPMLNDRERNEAFDRVIRRHVRGDTVVLDIGTGSGLLALMAARAGARHVYACEAVKPLAERAEAIIARNGYAERITVIPKRSDRVRVGVDMPERAHLLVTETVGIGVIGERIIDIVALAQRDLLVPGAPVIPRRGTVYAALIESRELVACERVNEAAGFDVSDFNAFSAGDRALQRRLANHRHRLLSAACEVFDFDLTHPAERGEHKRLRLAVNADGTCHGIAFWFTLFVDEHTPLSCAPDNPDSHWDQAVQLFPSERPVTAGETVEVTAVHDTRRVSFRL